MNIIEAVSQVSTVTIGSIWRIPNKIWTTSFAGNKAGEEYHPGLVGRIRKDKITASLIPGTSKDYKKGSCVFRTRLTPFSKRSYFLIMLSMPVLIEDMEQFHKGWNSIESLSFRQLQDLKLQIGFCKGASVAY